MSESWIKVIAKAGAWAVLAGWLVYRLDSRYGEDLKAARTEIAAATAAIERHSLSTSPIANGMVQLVNLQLQQCVNATDSSTEREKCFDAMWRTPERTPR